MPPPGIDRGVIIGVNSHLWGRSGSVYPRAIVINNSLAPF